MNNRIITLILFCLLSILFVGLEIIPKWGEKVPFINPIPSAKPASKEFAQSLLKQTCLSCHSLKYDDAFTYTKHAYDAVEKRYGVLPMDLSLIGKIYSKASIYASFQKNHAYHEAMDTEQLSVIVGYLFEAKNEEQHNRIGIYVLGFLFVFALLVYLKILLQQKERPHL